MRTPIGTLGRSLPALFERRFVPKANGQVRRWEFAFLLTTRGTSTLAAYERRVLSLARRTQERLQ